MKIGLSSMSFRNLGQKDALEAIAATGATALDFIIILPMARHLNVAEAQGDELKRLKDGLDRLGLAATSLNGSRGRFNDPNTRDDQIDWMRHAIRVAAALGASTVTTAAGGPPSPGQSWLSAAKPVAKDMAELCRLAADAGVNFSFETHINTLADAPQMAADLIELIGEPAMRLTYDPSHVASRDYDAVEWAGRLAQHICHFHVRDARPGAVFLTPGDGVIDFAAMFEAIQQGCPEGLTASFELEGRVPDPAGDVERAKAHFRKIMPGVEF